MAGPLSVTELGAKTAATTDLGPLANRVAAGEFDIVAVGRALLVDPLWARKVREGRFDELQPFTQAALDKALADGHPVFAYFTADWCLSCKVNERVAIERESTRDAFAKAGVVVLKGDWTRRDPAITRYLTARGAAGVPLYVWYGREAQSASPKTLPQVLTPKTLAELASN